MNSPLLRKTIFISALWHMTVFGIFNISSGQRFHRFNFPGVSFWGQILSAHDFMHTPGLSVPGIKDFLLRKPDTALLDKNRKFAPVLDYYLKPKVNLAFNQGKEPFIYQPVFAPFIAFSQKKSVVMFYPSLPYHFLLYFKDRQAAHIELMFKINPGLKANSISIKRKISSGNLEVDLLTARYLSRYLFIQQMGFPANSWQTVKIELTPKND